MKAAGIGAQPKDNDVAQSLRYTRSDAVAKFLKI